MINSSAIMTKMTLLLNIQVRKKKWHKHIDITYQTIFILQYIPFPILKQKDNCKLSKFLRFPSNQSCFNFYNHLPYTICVTLTLKFHLFLKTLQNLVSAFFNGPQPYTLVLLSHRLSNIFQLTFFCIKHL